MNIRCWFRFWMMIFYFNALNALIYRDEILVMADQKYSTKESDAAIDQVYLPDEDISIHLNPFGPLVPCQYLSSDYYQCESIEDIPENESRSCQKKLGRRFGGEKHSEVEHTSIICQIYDGIECYGNRTFLKDNVPCIKYTSHDFLSTLFYSIFLGLFAVDRYSLGHIGIAVGKMITLGGLGLWWIIDIILLIYGKLMPADDSNWIQQR